ncbi:STAS domain-containing protein [Bailinhaonella thermotolerans]|nr:STAS domain-containing protein [Bailinhaonella thermotolerans]
MDETHYQAQNLRVVAQSGALYSVLATIGELDVASASIFGVALDQILLRPGTPRVILDVSQLTFCDSVGLGQLIRARKLIESRGGALALAGVRTNLSALLRITALDSRFPRHPSVEAAVVDLTFPLGGDAGSRRDPHMPSSGTA